MNTLNLSLWITKNARMAIGQQLGQQCISYLSWEELGCHCWYPKNDDRCLAVCGFLCLSPGARSPSEKSVRTPCRSTTQSIAAKEWKGKMLSRYFPMSYWVRKTQFMEFRETDFAKVSHLRSKSGTACAKFKYQSRTCTGIWGILLH